MYLVKRKRGYIEEFMNYGKPRSPEGRGEDRKAEGAPRFAGGGEGVRRKMHIKIRVCIGRCNPTELELS
jgi:hypothetical protein